MTGRKQECCRKVRIDGGVQGGVTLDSLGECRRIASTKGELPEKIAINAIFHPGRENMRFVTIAIHAGNRSDAAAGETIYGSI
jgi:hypothetical protein